MRSLVLLLAVVLPGITATSLSTYFLLPEWAVLEASYKNYQQLANPSTMRDLFIAPAAKNRHPINCFAKEVRVLLGGASQPLVFTASVPKLKEHLDSDDGTLL